MGQYIPTQEITGASLTFASACLRATLSCGSKTLCFDKGVSPYLASSRCGIVERGSTPLVHFVYVFGAGFTGDVWKSCAHLGNAIKPQARLHRGLPRQTVGLAAPDPRRIDALKITFIEIRGSQH